MAYFVSTGACGGHSVGLRPLRGAPRLALREPTVPPIPLRSIASPDSSLRGLRPCLARRFSLALLAQNARTTTAPRPPKRRSPSGCQAPAGASADRRAGQRTPVDRRAEGACRAAPRTPAFVPILGTKRRGHPLLKPPQIRAVRLPSSVTVFLGRSNPKNTVATGYCENDFPHSLQTYLCRPEDVFPLRFTSPEPQSGHLFSWVCPWVSWVWWCSWWV